MKKLLTALLITLACVLTSSCAASCANGGNGGDENAASGNYIYMFAVVDGVAYKYNIKTGFASTMCDDPLCRHDSGECPFYGVGEDFFNCGGSVYYSVGGSLCRYDTGTGERHRLFDADGIIAEMEMADGIVYYNAVAFDYAPDAERPVSVDIYSYDTETGKTEKLNDESLYDTQRLYSADGGELVWCDNGLGNMYVTDEHYKNRRELDGEYYGITAGSRSYSLEVSSTSPVSFDVCAAGPESGEKYTVLHDTASVRGYKECLLATYNSDEGKYIGVAVDGDGGERDIYEYLNGDIYIYDENGENGRLLCSLPDGCIIESLAQKKDTMESGDYIGVFLREYTFDGDGRIINISRSKDIAIVNVKTGEYIITKSR